MKILAWNLNHRTRPKDVPAEVVIAASKLGADILVLNEYVDRGDRQEFKAGLVEAGFSHLLISEPLGKENQILIASRVAIVRGDLCAPTHDNSARTNFLHVLTVDQAIEIVGVRAPAYKTFAERQQYWRQLAQVMRTAANRRIVFIGDVNYDPFQGPYALASKIQFELGGAYSIPNPAGEWSFISLDEVARTRIDHVFVSSSLHADHVEYVAKVGDIRLAGGKDSGAVSDHAALLAAISCKT